MCTGTAEVLVRTADSYTQSQTGDTVRIIAYHRFSMTWRIEPEFVYRTLKRWGILCICTF